MGKEVRKWRSIWYIYIFSTSFSSLRCPESASLNWHSLPDALEFYQPLVTTCCTFTTSILHELYQPTSAAFLSSPYLLPFIIFLLVSGLVVRRLLWVVDLVGGEDKVMWSPCLWMRNTTLFKIWCNFSVEQQRCLQVSVCVWVILNTEWHPVGTCTNNISFIWPGTHVVDGVFKVEDAVFQWVADVIFWVAGRRHLLVQGSFHQFFVLRQKNKAITVLQYSCVTLTVAAVVLSRFMWTFIR